MITETKRTYFSFLCKTEPRTAWYLIFWTRDFAWSWHLGCFQLPLGAVSNQTVKQAALSADIPRADKSLCRSVFCFHYLKLEYGGIKRFLHFFFQKQQHKSTSILFSWLSENASSLPICWEQGWITIVNQGDDFFGKGRLENQMSFWWIKIAIDDVLWRF